MLGRACASQLSRGAGVAAPWRTGERIGHLHRAELHDINGAAGVLA